MSDVLFVATMVVFFALAIGLVRVIGRMIERDTDADGLADELSDIADDGPYDPARHVPAPRYGSPGRPR